VGRALPVTVFKEARLCFLTTVPLLAFLSLSGDWQNQFDAGASAVSTFLALLFTLD
jgi:hypothetical protein